MACNKLDCRLSSSFLSQRPIEAVMKGSEQVRFQIQYLRAFSIAPLPILRDRLQHTLPNFCRQSRLATDINSLSGWSGCALVSEELLERTQSGFNSGLGIQGPHIS